MKSFVKTGKIEGRFLNQIYMVAHYPKYENQSMRDLYTRSHQWNMIRKNKLMLECIMNERSQKEQDGVVF